MSGRDEEVTVIRENPLFDSLDGDEGHTSYVVVLSGRGVGRMFRTIRGTMRLGRHPDNDIVLDEDGVSRSHAELYTNAKGESFLRDLDSTNGTFIETERVSEQLTSLPDGGRIRIGPATILKYGRGNTVEEQFISRLYHSATRDGLTGCYKREYFEDHLDNEVAWHRRHDEPLSVLLVDLDHFKLVNDTYGHQAGDEVLRGFVELLRGICRAEDVIARVGGEEFSVVLRRTTADEARHIAERIRSAVSVHPFKHGGHDIHVTVSIGVLTRSGARLTTRKALIASADALLYDAKHGGRDKVCSS